MAAWSPQKISSFKSQFYKFLNCVRIDSKDLGEIILGEHLFEAQHRYFDAVFDALAEDIHDIKHLKSRQLGISTASRAFLLFWIGMFDGLKGYMILDTDAHKEEARLELINMIDNLPEGLNFPSRDKASGGSSNRNILKLSNRSTIIFTSAGVSTRKSGGTLGRSSGVNFCWCSEMCSWENIEGLEAFRNSLSDIYENRLYLWESTGRGFNQWWDMWNSAREDPSHQKCHFTGWWGKDFQKIPKTHPDFARYGLIPVSPEEHERINEVRERYGWNISIEQLAWFRRHVDPSVDAADGGSQIVEADSLQLVEQPWTEDDAFASGNSIFFDAKQLTDIAKRHASNKFKGYTYFCGYDFMNMRVIPAMNLRSVQLKVWDEPDPDGVYVVAVDPAFGTSEENDRSCIQVLRCYADGLDQVAEYAWPLITTEQLSWVIAHILGYYRNCYFVLELNGPGDAVFRSLKNLKREITRGTLHGVSISDDFDNIFANVKFFIFQKSDTMFAGSALMMKTTGDMKVTIMEKLRDYVSNGMLHIKSVNAIDEMKSVERKGDSIEASGANKDDRVLSLAFGVHYWQDSIRLKLSQQRITRENVIAKRRLSIRDLHSIYVSSVVADMFKKKRDEKKEMLRMLRKQERRR